MIMLVESQSKIVANSATCFNIFTAVVCSSLYGVIGYSILKARFKKQGTLLGKVELKYLVCAILTFVPLILDITRMLIDRIISGSDSSGKNPTLARRLWMVSNELQLGVQFSTLVVGTRLYRLITDHPFCNRTRAVQRESQTANRRIFLLSRSPHH